jgi:diphosphomevalonate decarboxylase
MTAHSEQDAWLSGIYYWQPATMGLIQVVQRWRRDGLEVYFTIDAGPNVHLLCEAKNQKDLEEALAKQIASSGGSFIVSKPADGARVVEESLI